MRVSLLSSLRFRLLLLIAAALLPAFALNLYSSVQQRRWAAAETQRSALATARGIAHEQAHVTETVKELLTALSTVPAIRAAHPVECPAVLGDLLERYRHYTSMSVVTPEGRLVCRGLRPGEAVRIEGMAVESAFRGALATGAFTTGDYAIGTVSRKPVVPFAFPILDRRGEVQAVLTATLDLVWLSRYASDPTLPPGAALTLLDRSGTVLARFPDPERWVGTRVPTDSRLVSLLASDGEGVIDAVGLDGVARLYAYSPLPMVDTASLLVVVGIPRRQAFAAANELLVRNLLLLSLLGIGTVALGWALGTRMLLRPVHSLVGATRRIAGGELSARAPAPAGGGELAELSHAFNEMAETLEERTAETARSVAALRREELRYRTVVEATSAIVWNMPPSGRFETPQPRWAEFTGQPFDEHRGWGWLAAIHPDDREHSAQRWRVALESGAAYEIEQRVRRADGEFRHMLMRAVPIRDGRGEVVEWIGIHTDITARKEAEAERLALLERAEAARSEAERANRAKSDFLAIVSHELRTPLTSIISYAELMASHVGGTLTERHEEFVGRIDASAWHLTDLVDQILEFTRLEAGRVTVQIAPTDVANVAREAIADITPLSSAKSLVLRADIPSGPLLVDTDPTKVRQILLNLLSNAVKFCDEGEIALSVSRSNGHIQMRVSDSGPGIAPEHLDRIWETFWQAENPLIRRAGGTGLGLAIVRRLTGLLGGRVRVESVPGEGSTFFLELPCPALERDDAREAALV